jgi:hypothetical protein
MSLQDHSADSLRLALFASPRMGNTWLRALLKFIYRLNDYAAHDPAEIPWEALPTRALVNLHVPPSPSLRAQIGDCRAIVVARHPFDTLISILHYAARRGSSSGWLGGAGGNEETIREATPIAPAFREYAVGPRAEALFTVSASWWNEPGTIRTRYESLVADTAGELQRICNEIGQPPTAAISEAVAVCAIDQMRVRNESHFRHAWKGQPNLWKSLIPAPLAREIAAAHAHVFATLGYECDPDETLTETQAWANWLALEAETHQRDKEQLWQAVHAARADAAHTQVRLAESEAHRRHLAERLAELSETRSHLAKTEAQLAIECARREELLQRLIQVDDMLKVAHEQRARAEARAAHAENSREALANRLNAAEKRLAETQARAKHAEAGTAALTERLIAADKLINEAAARAAILENQLAETMRHRQDTLATVDRLTSELAALRAVADEQAALLAQLGPIGFAVGRRLTRLSTVLSRAAGRETVHPASGEQRAA